MMNGLDVRLRVQEIERMNAVERRVAAAELHLDVLRFIAESTRYIEGGRFARLAAEALKTEERAA